MANRALGRLALTLAIVIFGLIVGLGIDVDGLAGSAAYGYVIGGLLAIGLYSSTRGIDLSHMRADWKAVLLAVTLGVVLKAALISAVMVLVFRRPEFLVLGIAVAQIDPLSVAALQRGSRMTERGKQLLLAWASFDDPVTMLLTIYVSAITLSLYPDIVGTGSGELAIGGLAEFLGNLAANLALALAVFAIYACLRVRRWNHPKAILLAECALLGVAFSVATVNFLMLGMALIGLFVRPPLDRLVSGLTSAALLASTLLLGMLLVLGVAPLPGLVLGIAAFAGQVLVSRLITRGRHGADRVYLALAQQNGITAIILALLLETSFAGTVAVVGPAILMINLLHLVTNAMYAGRDRRVRELMLTTIVRKLEDSCACPPGYADGEDRRTADARTGFAHCDTRPATKAAPAH